MKGRQGTHSLLPLPLSQLLQAGLGGLRCIGLCLILSFHLGLALLSGQGRLIFAVTVSKERGLEALVPLLTSLKA